MAHWEKQNMLYVLNLKEGVALRFIHSYGFLMHQILGNKAAYLEFTEETMNAQYQTI